MHHCSCNRSEFHFPFNPSQECDSSSSGRSRGRAMSSALRALRKVHSSELDGLEGGNRLLGCVGVARHSSLTYSPPLGCSRHCEHAGACSERDVPSRRKGQQSAAWYINLFSLWLSCLFWRFHGLVLLSCFFWRIPGWLPFLQQRSQAWFKRMSTLLRIL